VNYLCPAKKILFFCHSHTFCFLFI
jgi:hypothetical protein